MCYCIIVNWLLFFDDIRREIERERERERRENQLTYAGDIV